MVALLLAFTLTDGTFEMKGHDITGPEISSKACCMCRGMKVDNAGNERRLGGRLSSEVCGQSSGVGSPPSE